MRYFILIIFSLIFSYNTCFAAEIQCRYMTDYQKNQQGKSDPIFEASEGKEGKNPTKFDLFTTVLSIGEMVYNEIDNDIFFCTYTGNSNNARDSAVEFLEKLRDKKIIPLFFYDGWTSKFYKEFNYEDVNTPFSPKREKGAQEFEFVFRKRSVKSTIKFFGFYFQEENTLLCWAVDKKNAQIRLVNQEEFKEVKEKYLK